MNDYDDSDDYSSSNSFRARSNTWPLNRPDLALPNGVCIDETLPEIELEEDDLFTTNENWSTGLVDHDIMSWDPILNAQNLHHQPTQAFVASTTTTTTTNTNQTNPLTQSATIHHHHQPQQQQQQQQQQQHTLHQHHQHHQQQPHQQQHHHHQHQSQQQQQPHESLLSGSSIIVANQSQHQPHDALLGGGSNIIAGAAQCQHQQSHQHHLHHHQQQQQIPPQAPQHQQPQQQQHHQTLNNTHCLEQDDPNEYHIQQLHHLRLDNNQDSSEHQTHYISSLSTSSVCIQSSTASLGGPTENYNISSDHPSHHHHHQLQPLTSARYDLDQHNDLDLKTLDNEKHHHHLHHLTSTSLDHHTSGSHMLSSSLSTSGICLSGDLEDLDYKGLDPSQILQANHLEDPGQQDQQLDQQQQQLQQGDNGGIGAKQSNSASKTKLNTPRRNAWGNMSYADLISQAINSTNDKRLTLSQIYDWMVQHVPYFKDKGDSNSSAGWKNSVRHNLSLHNRFKRLQNEGAGKSSWWTINPEANVGKCARRRAASMEASKYEKKRGRAKKKADAIRQGLVSYPSLTNSSLNGSTGNLEQSQPQPCNQFGPQQQPTQPQQATDPNLMDQKQNLQQDLQQQQQPQHQQPQHQQVHGLNSDNLHNRQPNTGLYVAPSQEPQYDQSLRYHHYELSTPL